MKYTKGPWRLSETPKDAIFNRYLLTGPGNEIIATIHAPIAPVELSGSEVDANALLISSAPDLLEACKMVLRELLSQQRQRPIPERDGERFEGVVDTASQAIKRATGD